MLQFTAQIKKEGNVLKINIPTLYNDGVVMIIEKLISGYATISIKKPAKPRTIGEHSQNHAINGFVAQIAAQTGNDFDAVKHVMKKMAISQGYPFRTETVTGEIVPYSETELNTEQAAILITYIKQFAAEYLIMLKE